VPGPELGDYTGLPLTEAARLRADSWDADRISVVQEYQCRPHSLEVVTTNLRSNFKKQADGAGWNPRPCAVRQPAVL